MFVVEEELEVLNAICRDLNSCHGTVRKQYALNILREQARTEEAYAGEAGQEKCNNILDSLVKQYLARLDGGLDGHAVDRIGIYSDTLKVDGLFIDHMV